MIEQLEDSQSPHARQIALLIIAHGSRQAGANADVFELVVRLRDRAIYPIVEAAFLELAQPDIDQGGTACVEHGANEVILLPYFLAAGVHVRRDLAEACRRLAERYPEIRFRLAEPLGPHRLLEQIVLERARDAEDRY